MKIVLTSVGTRGDMEPFLAIGQLLKGKGHQVICAFPEQFAPLAENAGLAFCSLGAKFIQLLDSDAGRAAMGGATGYKKLMGTIRLALNQKEANKELLLNQQEIIEHEAPDLVLYNGKATFPIIWKSRTGGKTIFVSPLPYMHYVEGHTHVAFNGNYGNFFNKLTFALADFGMTATLNIGRKWLGIKEKLDRKKIKAILKNNKSIYAISPTLFPRPPYWSEELQVLGYHERENVVERKPDEALQDFVSKHTKILLITFGSMINAAPKEKTAIFLEILQRHKIPAIINTASGGLLEPEQYDSQLIHFVSRVAYDWIFPKVYAVIHHGGSGTTHLALKYGCAMMIIPHIIDQFVWNKIVHEKGAGPKGIKINKIKVSNLEPLVLDLINNPDYKENAKRIGQQMFQEDFEEELYQFITT